jgi:hypothetical protein
VSIGRSTSDTDGESTTFLGVSAAPLASSLD